MSEENDYDRKEKVVQTEQSFSVSVKQTRGTDVRDQDEVDMSWKMERKPPREALDDLASDIIAVMSRLRDTDNE